MNTIYPNMVLQWVKEEVGNKGIKQIRLIWFSPSSSYGFYVELQKESTMPKMIDISVLRIEMEIGNCYEVKDPYDRIVQEENIKEAHRKKRDELWEIVDFLWQGEEPDILFSNKRPKKIKEAVQKFGHSKSKILRIMKRFWQRGMTKNALLPDYDYCGGQGKRRKSKDKKLGRPRKVNYDGEVVTGININARIEGYMQTAIDLYYRKKQKPSLKETYYFMLRKFFSNRFYRNGKEEIEIWDENRIPTYEQFYYWFKKHEDKKIDIVTRMSEKEFELKRRPLLGNSTMETFGPGSRYQIDATIADVYLVSKINPNRVIGRPVVYALIDVYSRMVAGLYVGLEGPSWIGAMMALDNAVEDKVVFCKKYGIDIKEEDWPCKYLPETIIADRGEFEGYQPANLINNLNIKIENTPPYRGDLKGIVERRFRTINEKIRHMTPGAIQKQYRERGDIDYRYDATLNLDEFIKVMIYLVLQYNHQLVDGYPREYGMMADEVQPIPVDMWRWGIENRKGAFIKKDKDILRLNILPQGKAGISRKGVRFQGLYYSSPELIKKQWFVKLERRSVEIVYDPRNMNYIYIPSREGEAFTKCYLLEKSSMYKNQVLEEIVFQQELERELKKRNVNVHNQIKANIDKEIEAIIHQAKKTVKSQRKGSVREKVKNIKKNRAEEKQINREQEQFELGQEESKQGEIVDFRSTIPVKQKQNHAKSNRLELLRKKRDEKLGKRQ